MNPTDNPDLNWYRPWDYNSSNNAGAYEASKGYSCSPQQHDESWVSYQTRVNSYNWIQEEQKKKDSW